MNRYFTVLGVRIGAVQIPDVIAQMQNWIEVRDGSHWIEPAGMHGLAETLRNPRFRKVLNDADLAVPDGMPLVWLGRRQGFALQRRVYGPELLESFCRWTGAKYRHFFYGGAPGVADRLASTLEKRYGIRTVGTHSPPFRPLTAEEDREIVRMIRTASPDVLWVGLGMPEKERWMFEHPNLLGVSVMVGAGAAFDLISGRVPQAPQWIREHGLEWLFRLLHEPQRLWHRYLVLGPQFAWYSALEALGLKRFD